jgi:hypothetical protein
MNKMFVLRRADANLNFARFGRFSSMALYALKQNTNQFVYLSIVSQCSNFFGLNTRLYVSTFLNTETFPQANE